jgi:tricorn protease
MPVSFRSVAGFVLLLVPALSRPAEAQEARLLRQPDLSESHIAFTYGSDVWIVGRQGGEARRITSTAAVESDPHFSPDGRRLAFTSNRSGIDAVYVVPIEGGAPTRLTWYPSSARARGWTPDGHVLYSSSREASPGGYSRLWTVAPDGGPSVRLPAPRGNDASYAQDGRRLAIEPISRWDVEWRGYRGGQNQPLVILDLETLGERRLPGDRTTDVQPLWLGDTIYYLSDRDWAMNVWAYDPATEALRQVTRFTDAEAKWLAGHDGTLVIEQDGWIHTVDPATGRATRVPITVLGDFPWMEPRWDDVSDQAGSASLSPTGQRIAFEARGEIFTVPAKKGDARNLSRSPDAADRRPVWSPDGASVAWFSDAGGDGYALVIAGQDGLSEPRRIDIGESKLGWEPAWSPDGSRIAFVDDDVRVRIVNVESGELRTIDVGGTNIERGDMGLTWSHDSKWLAYAKTFPNNLGRIVVWSVDRGDPRPVTDMMANASSPTWDRDGRHLYFLASTDVALGSGWANTSSMKAEPTYSAWVSVLRADDPTPFPAESDEEEIEEEATEDKSEEADEGGDEKGDEEKDEEEVDEAVRIDFDGIERRIIALPLEVARYGATIAGPEGTVFITEYVPGGDGATLHRFTLEDRESKEFATGVSQVSVSKNGEKMLFRSNGQWRIVGTAAPPSPGDGAVDVSLSMLVDRGAEWKQIFDEAWRYQRDYFYDPGMHGNDWDAVYRRYSPLVPHVRHRADLNYVLDQTNGELSVGHSFVFGGDMPEVDTPKNGLLGADLEAHDGGWRIARIFTSESWNPGLSAPLDQPGLDVSEGDYVVGVNGERLTASMDPYRVLDGTSGRQTVLHVSGRPSMEGARTVTVEPIGSETGLRQRAWVEDNRRKVDELSGGRVAYAWIPNTGGGGVVSFDRYFFAQQDRQAAVIDERFNGGGLLDDYMVDLMTRTLRAAITNEVPNGRPFRLPAGILGPKVLLINEMAGSGGDFFPWVFRHQKAGPLIGKRTWGGLVKSSVHYALIDGGALTAPDNAVFDPVEGRFIAENEGVPPDIEIEIDARSAADGRDPQLERAVEEALRLLDEADLPAVRAPSFPRPSKRPGN